MNCSSIFFESVTWNNGKKAKINEWDLVKRKSFAQQRKSSTKLRDTLRDRTKYLQTNATDKDFFSKQNFLMKWKPKISCDFLYFDICFTAVVWNQPTTSLNYVCTGKKYSIVFEVRIMVLFATWGPGLARIRH